MKITLKAYGHLRERIEEIPYLELEEETTILELLDILELEGERVLCPFVNGKKASFQASLKEGDRITLLSPLAWGSRLFPLSDLLRAVEVRTSRRDYLPRSIEEEEKKRIHQLADELEADGSCIQVVRDGGEEVFKGIIGSYGIIKNARTYAVFIGKRRDPHYLEKTGYYGQAFILALTSMGLGSCWMAGFFRRDGVMGHIELRDEEEILAVTPIGYVDTYSFKEKAMRRMVRGHRRKELRDLVRGLERSEWDPWIVRSLELARLAPSALNRQPWRFLVAEDSITVEMDKRVRDSTSSKRLDCGIAMFHLELGARLSGLVGSWEYLSSPQVACFSLQPSE